MSLLNWRLTSCSPLAVKNVYGGGALWRGKDLEIVANASASVRAVITVAIIRNENRSCVERHEYPFM